MDERTGLLQNQEPMGITEHTIDFISSAPQEDSLEFQNWASPPSEFKPPVPTQPYESLPVISFDPSQFTEANAKECVERWVNSTWFKQREFIFSTLISSISPSSAFVSKLETFTEHRDVHPAHRPYHHDHIDDHHHGNPPHPWEVPVIPPSAFVNHKISMPLPHTEHVKCCFECHGKGKVKCHSCHGESRMRCSICNGQGFTNQTRWVTTSDNRQVSENVKERCSPCTGDGFVICRHCHHGWQTCRVCDGSGDLIHYQKLTIHWVNAVTESIVKEVFDPELKRILPDSKLSRASGDVILAEENYQLFPSQPGYIRVNNSVDKGINQLLMNSHDSLKNKALHRQRLITRGMPVYEITYIHDHKSKRLWIYGTDHQVHAPDYPLSGLRISGLVLLLLIVIGVIGFLIYWFAFHK